MKLAEKKDCMGCLACKMICPRKCIEIEKDSLGNIYPVIINDNCISCGKCRKACPSFQILEFKKPNKAYAVWSLDAADRKSSASGGAASVFYRTAVENGFDIVGTEFTDDFSVIHTVSDSADAISRYKQSKYVFSDASACYEQIKKELKCGKNVLFISLPCKVAGLKAYLGCSNENLTTVDIVCHGTPSADLLKRHIEVVSGKAKAKKLRFRKDNLFLFSLEDEAGKKLYVKAQRTDTYLAAFLEGLDYRDACYRCRYARPERTSDITICDFWGLGSKIPFSHPYSGSVSAVLINTERGADFFERCREKLFVEERPVEEAIEGNAQLNAPTRRLSRCDEFESEFRAQGFEKAVKAVLKTEMREERKKQNRLTVRKQLRRLAGIFMRRYRS